MRLLVKAVLAMLNVCESQLDDAFRATTERPIELTQCASAIRQARRALVVYLDK
jgi:hypothetical protein